ncbi:surfeit locus 1 family protein [Methylopila capsulata]|uniref:SURF1-like protein n=1 Tax=Methylopila capsulata TaxID=61654 RepID=A0A9W6IUQ4_9HYPH|nr:SURF1 family protein [Methylopila capsulata]MBM7852717.1 surfeit locus 1 family protein [Methylopila capsulata]GLK56926.1 hypothetical protein GCM10008170_29450 [Methylopila capsulata]
MTGARKLLGAGLATLVALGLLVALGVWQLERLAWKNDLVARISARTEAPPVAAPAEADWPALDFDAWGYRRVNLTGTFAHQNEVRVYVALGDARGPLSGPGYFVLTPLVRADGSAVIVNRGFVPEPLGDPARRPETLVAGPVTVTGLLRVPEDRNLFTPADDPAKRLFFARDPKAIAAGLRLTRVAPFTVDADATPNPGGLPQGGETRLTFPNRHLEYALTWFGLAAALAAVFAVYAVRALREGKQTR